MNPELGCYRTGRLTPVHAVKCTGANTERTYVKNWAAGALMDSSAQLGLTLFTLTYLR